MHTLQSFQTDKAYCLVSVKYYLDRNYWFNAENEVKIASRASIKYSCLIGLRGVRSLRPRCVIQLLCNVFHFVSDVRNEHVRNLQRNKQTPIRASHHYRYRISSLILTTSQRGSRKTVNVYPNTAQAYSLRRIQIIRKKERPSLDETHMSYTERFRDNEFIYKALHKFSCLLSFPLLIYVYHS